jgi:DNA polymerase-3 subunit gamma/tau
VAAPASTAPSASAASAPPISDDDAPEPTEPDSEPAVDEAGWAVAEIPKSVDGEGAVNVPAPKAFGPPKTSTPRSQPAKIDTAEPAKVEAAPSAHEAARYGESVVREILGASFIEEQVVAPRVTPRES